MKAVKLGLFFENLLENDQLRAVAMATINIIKPDDQFEKKDLLYEFFDELDKEYNFKLGPAIIALSSASELKQLNRLDIPYLKAGCHNSLNRMVFFLIISIKKTSGTAF